MYADLRGYEFVDGDGNVLLVTGEPAPIPGYVEVEVIRPDDSVTKTYRVVDQLRRRRQLEAPA